MIRNLRIYNKAPFEKKTIHRLLSLLSEDLKFIIKNLEITFVNSEKIKFINNQYLKHNYSTDVITFNYSNNINEIDGEIVISLEDAKNNSKKFKNTIEEEVYRLIIHGVLHLIGFNDIKKNEKRIMKSKENYLVKKYVTHLT